MSHSIAKFIVKFADNLFVKCVSKLGQKIVQITGLLTLSLVVQPVMASKIFDKETVSVIQERIFDRKHEVTFSGGYIPDDDFYELAPLGVAYTYHFNNFVAWEVGRAQYVMSSEKTLKTRLEDRFSVTPEEFDRLNYMAHSTFLLKPTYGKDAFWNSTIINHETFFGLGAGIANYEREYSFGDPTEETVFSITAGMGRKYFLSKRFALNLELKSYTNFKDSETETNVYLGMGLSYRFNFSDRSNTVRQATDSIYQYLEDQDD